MAFGHWLAKLISNVYIVLMLAVEHHAEELLDFDAQPDEPKEVFYLRQLLGSKNFHSSARHEDLYTLGVNIHVEHHLFPDLPIHRLRRVERRVRAACARHGIPHNAESWPRAIAGLFKGVAIFSLPIQTTPARQRRRSLFKRLVDELNDARARRKAEPTRGSSADTRANDKPDIQPVYTLRLARRGLDIPMSPKATLLQSIEQAGLSIPTGCRKGACKTCVARKLDGRTTLERHRTRETIELCVARPVSDVTLDL